MSKRNILFAFTTAIISIIFISCGNNNLKKEIEVEYRGRYFQRVIEEIASKGGEVISVDIENITAADTVYANSIAYVKAVDSIKILESLPNPDKDKYYLSKLEETITNLKNRNGDAFLSDDFDYLFDPFFDNLFLNVMKIDADDYLTQLLNNAPEGVYFDDEADEVYYLVREVADEMIAKINQEKASVESKLQIAESAENEIEKYKAIIEVEKKKTAIYSVNYHYDVEIVYKLAGQKLNQTDSYQYNKVFLNEDEEAEYIPDNVSVIWTYSDDEQ